MSFLCAVLFRGRFFVREFFYGWSGVLSVFGGEGFAWLLGWSLACDFSVDFFWDPRVVGECWLLYFSWEGWVLPLVL